MFGFSASMTAEEVHDKSSTSIETREVKFDLIVPAREGRLVREKTIVTSVRTVYEAAIRAEGTVGIEFDPGFWSLNRCYWLYEIEKAFPDAEERSRIALNTINTRTSVDIVRLLKHHSRSNS
jgi:hypothetical protein